MAMKRTQLLDNNEAAASLHISNSDANGYSSDTSTVLLEDDLPVSTVGINRRRKRRFQDIVEESRQAEVDNDDDDKFTADITTMVDEENSFITAVARDDDEIEAAVASLIDESLSVSAAAAAAMPKYSETSEALSDQNSSSSSNTDDELRKCFDFSTEAYQFASVEFLRNKRRYKERLSKITDYQRAIIELNRQEYHLNSIIIHRQQLQNELELVNANVYRVKENISTLKHTAYNMKRLIDRYCKEDEENEKRRNKCEPVTMDNRTATAAAANTAVTINDPFMLALRNIYEAEAECSVCRNIASGADFIFFARCPHKICANCVNQMFMRNMNKCPECREPHHGELNFLHRITENMFHFGRYLPVIPVEPVPINTTADDSDFDPNMYIDEEEEEEEEEDEILPNENEIIIAITDNDNLAIGLNRSRITVRRRRQSTDATVAAPSNETNNPAAQEHINDTINNEFQTENEAVAEEEEEGTNSTNEEEGNERVVRATNTALSCFLLTRVAELHQARDH